MTYALFRVVWLSLKIFILKEGTILHSKHEMVGNRSFFFLVAFNRLAYELMSCLNDSLLKAVVFTVECSFLFEER